jgi:hypothetical protein
MTLRIKFGDILRATLSFRSGNEGWIGIAPDGFSYHIVAPVDTQIAKGVMACNRPTDGTPFGGYRGWVYFRIPPFISETSDSQSAKVEQAKSNAKELIQKLERFGIQAIVEETASARDDSKINFGKETRKANFVCSKCEKRWNRLVHVLKDHELFFKFYRACVDDFSKGAYVFEHNCGGLIEIPVSSFVKKPLVDKNLAGLHACPGLCAYEFATQECPAFCEGAYYRRVARKILKRYNSKR